jgi:hypothetical protein
VTRSLMYCSIRGIPEGEAHPWGVLVGPHEKVSTTSETFRDLILPLGDRLRYNPTHTLGKEPQNPYSSETKLDVSLSTRGPALSAGIFNPAEPSRRGNPLAPRLLEDREVQLAELIRLIGGESFLDTVEAIDSLQQRGYVTYDPDTMEIDLTPKGEFVNDVVAGYCG